ncbi:hypothetical protein ASPWEDRAFT_156713 [Aspergillus wentii DTO 134E9]|uniref:ribonuclease T1 n=1 Tax=Aspergillus wentii DTO 134E9 TaxID=1073089 RepID=A0A1L9RMQ2_ASPWE|nr:uncharacterized protein ASPWEDRAFT_156713 [Aspergillus wentii DTO 134E9]KAI9929337.1 hypothetical protein MW887_000805 [Aspergillus wentii]OJJ36225.1 hypothetical protein ASPWEDRAFT_156713 [Aspergillus wentii DTO 134E9]
MFSIKTILALVPIVATSIASTIPIKRESCQYTCGSTCYWSSDISDAQKKGYSLYKSGDTLHNYPHEYHDYEGFEFPVSGTYYEYPILSSFKVYTGGSPGADRVIFNEDDELAGLITHNGASGNNFVACKSS